MDFHAKPIGEPGRSLYIIARGHGKYSFSIFRVQTVLWMTGPTRCYPAPRPAVGGSLTRSWCESRPSCLYAVTSGD